MKTDKGSIISALKLWFRKGDVFEIRVLDAVSPEWLRPHMESGYFDYEHIPDAAEAIGKLRSYRGAYATVNPVNPDLLARACNRLRGITREATTSDSDILSRRWLLIDCDPKRVSGVSSSDAEHEAAISMACKIRSGLSASGWPDPILLDSGNGAQMMYRINLPVEDSGLVQRCIAGIATAGDDKVDVDLTVFNPARIWRIPGTMNCKGDDVKTRPHRMAQILSVPEKTGIVTPEQMETAASWKSAAPVVVETTSLPREVSDFDLDGWISRFCPELGQPQVWRDGRKWVFPVCPFNDAHRNRSAVLIQQSNGAIAFRCHHNSCTGNDWHKLRELRDPGCYDRKEQPLPDVDISGILAQKPKSEQAPQTKPEPLVISESGVPVITPEMEKLMEADDESAREALVESLPFPEELYQFPGLVGDVMNTTLKYATKPNRPLALSGALALMSYLAARKVKSPSGLRPNIYILALAGSGCGKERPRDINQLILESIQLDDGLLDKAASGEGIEDMLAVKPALLWQCDEFYSTLHDMLKEKKEGKDTTMEYLLKLYTNAHKNLKTRVKAGKPGQKIYFPHLTMYATTTPAGFFEHLNERFLNDGMYARLNVMIAEASMRGTLPVEPVIDPEIIEKARRWAQFIPPGSGNIDLHTFPVPYTADAAKLAKALYEKQEDEVEKAKRNEEPEWKKTVWNRACEIALRYALIYACSIAERPENTIITAEAIRWAEKFIWWEIRNKFFLTERHYFRTDFERVSESVMDVMRQWHRKNGRSVPMPGWKFNRRTSHLPPNVLKAVVESLEKQKRLVQMPWRKGMIYYLPNASVNIDPKKSMKHFGKVN